MDLYQHTHYTGHMVEFRDDSGDDDTIQLIFIHSITADKKEVRLFWGASIRRWWAPTPTPTSTPTPIQDWFTVSAAIELTLPKFWSLIPHAAQVILFSDGAGCEWVLPPPYDS